MLLSRLFCRVCTVSAFGPYRSGCFILEVIQNLQGSRSTCNARRSAWQPSSAATISHGRELTLWAEQRRWLPVCGVLCRSRRSCSLAPAQLLQCAHPDWRTITAVFQRMQLPRPSAGLQHMSTPPSRCAALLTTAIKIEMVKYSERSHSTGANCSRIT